MCDQPMTTAGRFRYGGAGDEPALSDLLADPILHLLLRCDRLSEDDLKMAIDRGRRAVLRAGGPHSPAV